MLGIIKRNFNYLTVLNFIHFGLHDSMHGRSHLDYCSSV